MSEKIIKSAERVKDIGEVFTPKKTVDFMLNQPEIKAKLNSLTATFLEPSAGEGAFLVELLRRKLAYAKKVSKNSNEMQNNFLQALSTLYGIEIMEDDVEMLVMNMNNVFRDVYFNTFTQKERNSKVLKSAQTIISANMAQGDTLKKKTSDDKDIIFSEWKPVGKDKVQRTECTFASIVNGDKIRETSTPEQLSLFADDDESHNEEPKLKHYKLVKWEDVYQQLPE